MGLGWDELWVPLHSSQIVILYPSHPCSLPACDVHIDSGNSSTVRECPLKGIQGSWWWDRGNVLGWNRWYILVSWWRNIKLEYGYIGVDNHRFTLTHKVIMISILNLQWTNHKLLWFQSSMISVMRENYSWLLNTAEHTIGILLIKEKK